MTADRCSGAERERGLRALAIARRWVGTPYRHQASCEGAGADCLGLMRGVWRELVGAEPEEVPPYTPFWAEEERAERLLDAALRLLVPVDPGHAMAGDVCLFRMRDRGPAKHLAILATDGIAGGRIVHAYSGHSVCETALTESWRRRLAGVFRFPGEGC